MSHEATNWAIKQRGLKPTTKIVLWHLCDRFNPDYGCFPSQDRLAHDCEISRSTLNDHLGQLEAVGLLRRVPRLDPVTKRQLSTRYILGFEPGFTPLAVVPCPEIGHGDDSGAERLDVADVCDLDGMADALPCPDFGHGVGAGAVSDFRADPCPENAESRVRNSDTHGSAARIHRRDPARGRMVARQSGPCCHGSSSPCEPPYSFNVFLKLAKALTTLSGVDASGRRSSGSRPASAYK